MPSASGPRLWSRTRHQHSQRRGQSVHSGHTWTHLKTLYCYITNSVQQFSCMCFTCLLNIRDKHICLYLQARSYKCVLSIDVLFFFPSNRNKYNLKMNINGKKYGIHIENGSLVRW